MHICIQIESERDTGSNELEESLVVSKRAVLSLEEPRRGLSHYFRSQEGISIIFVTIISVVAH